MNRDLKFRFWGKFGELNEEKDECENEMLYGDRFCFQNAEPIDTLFADKSFVVMQFTGLKDKNGKEIYEGDIDNKGRVCQYFKKLGSFGFKNPKHAPVTFLGQFNDRGNYVIGNIYENPELLNQ